jgi:hypothetical protein
LAVGPGKSFSVFVGQGDFEHDCSREWKLLDLHFPWGQINFFEPRVKAQERYPD